MKALRIHCRQYFSENWILSIGNFPILATPRPDHWLMRWIHRVSIIRRHSSHLTIHRYVMFNLTKGTPARFQSRFSTTAIQVAGSFSIVIYGRWHNNATFLAVGWDWLGSCFLLTGHNLPEKLIVDWPFGGGNWKGLTSLLEAFGMDREGQRKEMYVIHKGPICKSFFSFGPKHNTMCDALFFWNLRMRWHETIHRLKPVYNGLVA